MKKKILYFDCYFGICEEQIVEALSQMQKEDTRKKLTVVLQNIPDRPQRAYEREDMISILEESILGETGKNFIRNVLQYRNRIDSKKEMEALFYIAYYVEHLCVSAFVVSPLSINCGVREDRSAFPDSEILEILQKSGLKLSFIPGKEQRITPLGASIAAAMSEYEATFLEGKLMAFGEGRGEESGSPLVRAMLMETEEEDFEEKLWVLETNIDDSTGECIGYITEKLMEAGAKDVFCTSIFMKKNRPAVLLRIITEEENRTKLEDLIFLHTSTIGIRRYPVFRRSLKRHQEQIETQYGLVQTKVIEGVDGRRHVPEYEEVRRICEETGKGFCQIYEEICKEVSVPFSKKTNPGERK